MIVDRLRPSLDAIRQVAANAGLLRLEAASLAWSTAEATYLIGLLVLAYEAGGTTSVAFIAVLRALPSVVLAPLIMSLTAALPRDRLLRLVVAVRVACVVAATIEVVAGAPPASIYALAAIDAVAASLLRPLRATLVPALARSPEELVAANVATSTGDSLAALVGPAIAAVLLAVGDVPATFVAGSVVMVATMALVLRIKAAGSIIPRASAARDERTTPAPRGRSPLEAARQLLALRHARLIVLLFAGQRFVRGMITVLLVSAAFDLLDIGDSGVGVLTSAIGLGGLVGGAVALGLVGRRRLALAFLGGLVAWGVGILSAGIVPQLALVVAVLAIAGIGKVVLDVSGISLLQRTVPDEHRGQVFGFLEGLIAAALSIGPIAAAFLVDIVGVQWALVIAGGLPLVLALGAWPVLSSADDAAVVPERELRLLEGVAMFRPLQLTTIEQLAGQMVRVPVASGTDIVRQGDRGDTFFIVESGRLVAIVDGNVVQELSAGDSFGEIALLRESERTATVRALEPGVVFALACEPFLAAVTSQGESLAAADEVVRIRLESS
jgi:hypothetical protein